MKYYISEGAASDKLNAASKAREDVREIVAELGYNTLRVPTKNGVQTKKILKPYQVFMYVKNYFIWKQQLCKLSKGDEIIVEYPLINTTLFIDKAIKGSSKKGIKTTAVIHDLNSLRYTDIPRFAYEDKQVLGSFDKVISHNDSMTNHLAGLGVDTNKITNLQVFDYLYTGVESKCNNGDQGIIIAGNLAPEKAGYLSNLKAVENTKFNLYGIGYEKADLDINIDYRGAFKPDELIENLKGKFGLVWDGTSVMKCDGLYGEYLKYNNPHKASLYLASGIPLIVWEKSALAKFVKQNNVGIVVSSLCDLGQKIENISDAEYVNILENVNSVGEKVRKGKFLMEALSEE